MKNRIITNSVRTIKKSFSRFIPLFFMSFLAVFVFAGLQSLKPDMLITLDNYLDDHNIYDIKIISTLGLTDDDITKLKTIDNIKNVEGTYSKDVIIKDNEEDIVINIESMLENINTLKLVQGSFPKNKNEIVVEDNFVKKTSYKLNDSILIDGEEYLIVGTVDSALYFSNDELKQDRGTTSIGSGTINYYSYVLKENFNQDYYTAIYVTVSDALDKITSEEDYIDLVTGVTKDIDKIKLTQENRRYDSIYKEAEQEIKTHEKKINKELSNAKNELDEAKKKLDNAKKELDSLNEGLVLYKSGLNTFQNELEKATSEFNLALNNAGINESELEDTIKGLELILTGLPEGSSEYQKYYEMLNNLQKLAIVKNTIDFKMKDYNSKLEEYNNLSLKYELGNKEYRNGLKEYQDGLSKYNQNKNEALEKINDAKDELNKIKMPTWYINDRTNHEIYNSYIDDINSVNNLAQVFPIIFFGVAIMVSLISMNRMVEEDRGEIGTFKSLGFSNFKIIIKYVVFSSIATIFGGLLGGILGIIILPIIVFNIYGMLFNVPNFHVGFNLNVIFISLIIAVLCICGSTIITALKVLKEKPSDLIRPKPPKSGKKVFLENIKCIWNHINFSNKVFIRNMLRYKKRAFVTIFGISGCSALLLCGFGIRDAIVDIANMQYKETFTYDAMIYLNKSDNLIDADEIKNSYEAQNINVKLNNISANLMVVNEDVYEYINLVDKDNNKLVLEDRKAIITSKFARLNNLSVGDTISVMDDNNTTYTYEISGITNNYLMHYIYVLKSSFEKDYEYKTNVMFLNLNKEIDKDKLTSKLTDNEDVLSVIYIEDMLASADDMLKSLNKVVLIIIVLAASLSFIVLYNLSTINIDERKREISTLKVLGFYDREVDKYVTKENIVFTIIGIMFGLVFGYFLTSAVITTVEIEKASFIHHISLYSYIMTFLITMIFTLIVNLVMHFKLKKVDMIASLKSVD